MTTTRRQFLGGAAALGALLAVGAGAATAAPVDTDRKEPSKRNLIKNGSFEKGPLGVPKIADWEVTVVPV
jgi:hypothetical protein